MTNASCQNYVDLVDVECTNKTPLNITGAGQENVQIRHNKDRQQMI